MKDPSENLGNGYIGHGGKCVPGHRVRDMLWRRHGVVRPALGGSGWSLTAISSARGPPSRPFLKSFWHS